MARASSIPRDLSPLYVSPAIVNNFSRYFKIILTAARHRARLEEILKLALCVAVGSTLEPTFSPPIRGGNRLRKLVKDFGQSCYQDECCAECLCLVMCATDIFNARMLTFVGMHVAFDNRVLLVDLVLMIVEGDSLIFC